MKKAIKASPDKNLIGQRRDRMFAESPNATKPSTSVATHYSHEEYKSPHKWKRSSEDDNITRSSEMVNTSTWDSKVDLGRSTQIKLEILFKNGLKTKIYRGSIVHAKVDAIVNAANDSLNNCGGVAYVISQAAGTQMEQHCKRKLLSHKGRIMVTENVVTVGGNLPCKHVIHAVGPRWSDYPYNKADCLSDLSLTVTNILHRACEYKLKCVVMPPISAGIFGVPKDACAAMYLRAIKHFSENDLKEKLHKIREFHIVDIKDEMLDMIVQVYRHDDREAKNFLEPRQVLHRLPKYSKSYGKEPLLERNANTKQDGRWKWEQVNHMKRLESSYKEVFITTLNGKLNVQIYTGDITEVKNVDIIVSAEDQNISGQGMLARTILEKAGDDYENYHSGLRPSFLCKLLLGPPPPPLGEVLQTGAGTLNFKLVFHAIMRKFPDKTPSDSNLSMLWLLTSNILKKANEKPTCRKNKKMKQNCVSLAMSLLGTGSIKSTETLRQYADVVFQCISDFSQNKKLNLTEIHLVNFSKEVTDVIKEAFLKQNPNFTKSGRPVHLLRKPHSPVLQQKSKRHTTFDPSPYKLMEEWKASKNKKEKFDQFVESSTPNTKNVDKPYNDRSPTNKKNNSVPKKGNVNLIDSSEEESENETENATAAHGATCDSDYDNISDSKNAIERLDIESNIIQSTCVICMDDKIEDPVKLRKCQHEFCRECLADYFTQKPACPICNTVYGKMYGDQPEDGIATVYLDSEPLPGSLGHKTLIIQYFFPDGTQSQEHTSPGESYTGLSRQAYLPDDDKGKKVLTMLRKAFEQRLTFTVGVSHTSGRNDVVTWNDIHHKTRRDGGPERYGYPDPDYLDRVTEELNAKGIFEE